MPAGAAGGGGGSGGRRFRAGVAFLEAGQDGILVQDAPDGGRGPRDGGGHDRVVVAQTAAGRRRSLLVPEAQQERLVELSTLVDGSSEIDLQHLERVLAVSLAEMDEGHEPDMRESDVQVEARAVRQGLQCGVRIAGRQAGERPQAPHGEVVVDPLDRLGRQVGRRPPFVAQLQQEHRSERHEIVRQGEWGGALHDPLEVAVRAHGRRDEQ